MKLRSKLISACADFLAADITVPVAIHPETGDCDLAPPYAVVRISTAIANQKDRQDPDVRAFIAARAAAGEVWTPAKRTALQTFITAGKADGWWPLLGRLYLPTSGIAAANAICMKTRTSGTWIGGVTHAAGFAQADGTTGYFDTGVTVGSLGITTTDFAQFFLSLGGDSRNSTYVWGASYTGSEFYLGFMTQNATQLRTVSFSSVSRVQVWHRPAVEQHGIYIQTRTGGDDVIYRRSGSGFTTDSSQTVAVSGTSPTGSHMFHGGNYSGTPTYSTDAPLGAYGLSLAMGAAGSEAFSLALKTLWESLTGLTLGPAPAVWLDATQGLFDATSGGNPVADGGGVARWEDRSGYGRHVTQATAGNRPLLDLDGGPSGLPALVFDGGNDCLIRAGVAFDQPCTVFVVLKQISFTNADYIFDTRGASTRPSIIQRNPSGDLRGRADVPNPGLTHALGNWGIVSMVDTAAAVSLRLNDGTPVTAVSANTTSGATSLVLAATNYGSPAGHANIAIAEFIAYPGELSEGDQDRIRAYLRNKWGIFEPDHYQQPESNGNEGYWYDEGDFYQQPLP